MNKLNLRDYDPMLKSSIDQELQRQEEGLEMIPSENFVSIAVLEALGSILTNKYSEGYPGKRYYGGCHFIDEVEQLAIDRAKQLFGAEHVNVQPLSGAPANVAVYFALLNPGDTVLGMDLSHGGHLTHGHPVTYMTKIFNFIRYKTNAEGKIDLDNLRQMALEHKPKLILVGYSAYSREIEYEKIKAIADEVGAMTMADIAHIAGLIAAGEMNNPVPIFDVVTTTTHKTLRGPRGGMIMCKEKFAKQIKANAKILEKKFVEHGYKLMFGGTDNHLLLIDVTGKGLSGKEAEGALDKAGITVNKNMIPDDPRSPMDPSGIRLGTPALTTRGMKEAEMEIVADMINDVIMNWKDENKLLEIKNQVKELTSKFPLYPELK